MGEYPLTLVREFSGSGENPSIINCSQHLAGLSGSSFWEQRFLCNSEHIHRLSLGAAFFWEQFLGT
jgi:hypothetical protein